MCCANDPVVSRWSDDKVEYTRAGSRSLQRTFKWGNAGLHHPLLDDEMMEHCQMWLWGGTHSDMT